MRLPTSMVLRGRAFSHHELKKVRELTEAFATHGRTRISEEVCRALNWIQPNGWLKDRACRDVLRQLASQNMVRLPKSKIKRQKQPLAISYPQPNINVLKKEQTIVTSLSGPIYLTLAKGNADERIWNKVVCQHHYLGHKVTVGKCLKFLVYSCDVLIGAISLSESAWAVADRDEAITMLGFSKYEVANNSRFLILPHVRIKHLASRILGLFAKDGVVAWERYYSIRLRALETFVDSIRFEGTSYRAANWIMVGTTRGYRKSGAQHFNSQTPKYVFLYPLDHRDRKRLSIHVSNIPD